jgi:hypothetical protein
VEQVGFSEDNYSKNEKIKFKSKESDIRIINKFVSSINFYSNYFANIYGKKFRPILFAIGNNWFYNFFDDDLRINLYIKKQTMNPNVYSIVMIELIVIFSFVLYIFHIAKK